MDCSFVKLAAAAAAIALVPGCATMNAPSSKVVYHVNEGVEFRVWKRVTST